MVSFFGEVLYGGGYFEIRSFTIQDDEPKFLLLSVKPISSLGFEIIDDRMLLLLEEAMKKKQSEWIFKDS